MSIINTIRLTNRILFKTNRRFSIINGPRLKPNNRCLNDKSMTRTMDFCSGIVVGIMITIPIGIIGIPVGMMVLFMDMLNQ